MEWLAILAEDLVFDEPYSAVVAAEAFHWLDWERVVPRIAAGLVDGGRLILVQRGLAQPLPWEPELRSLISEYSRARLDAGRAQEFDDTLGALVRRHCPDGTVQLPVEARLVWMRPVAS